MRCTGCGSAETIEEIRAKHPKALSCCPERNMVERNAYGEYPCEHGQPMPSGCNPCRRKIGEYDKDGNRAVALVS